MPHKVGPYDLNKVYQGDCKDLVLELPDNSVDILITSPPYWGQRISLGTGTEEDPRDYLIFLSDFFSKFLPKLKSDGIIWINIGDAYNTPVNWRKEDFKYSSLGADKNGLSPENTAYTKKRAKRKAYIDKTTNWLQYGNLLALPYRLVIALCDLGYLYRGEVIWRKINPMPEGVCRRPHRQHESIYLLTKSERHQFRVKPPVKSVWDFSNEQQKGKKHCSRFPLELPTRCIDSYGKTGEDVIVLDPFSGSGTTGIAAITAGCSYVGFEIDKEQQEASNMRLKNVQVRLPIFSDESSSTRQLQI
ncbi:DNA-methyltransferase [Desulfuromonas thiophila]|uniref:DNA-methyltransferase n=1 Tax=Desulfuromonas thiophila TaxID=57664 RepID=UPI0024A80B7D|nr:site-specific DNA-methyltransferase [Desulfuromonas thiophila]